MLPTTPQWITVTSFFCFTLSLLSFFLLFFSFPFIPFDFFCQKVDPTNRIRTSDLRNSITNYSPPLYQLSYGRCPIYLFFFLPFLIFSFYSVKKLHRRESNPGHKRERLVCYQLHHNGLLLLLFFALLFPYFPFSCFFFIPFDFFCQKVDPTNRIRTSDLRKSITNYSPPLYQLSYGRYPDKQKKKTHKRNGETTHKQKNSIAGNRTRGTNVKGLYVTNYTTMDNWERGR